MPTESGDEIKIISNEVQELISYKPVWIVRNGITLFLLIIVSLVAITFFISYPDIIHANAKLTSINAPKEVKIKTEGKLIKLYAVEGKLVEQNEILGFLESRADHQEVLSLSKIVDTLQIIIETDNIEKFSKYTSISFKNLGEIQQAFQTFMQSFNLFGQYLSQGYYLKKKKMLLGDIGYLHQLHVNLLQQKALQQQDVGLAKQTLEANQSLDKDKVISRIGLPERKK
jgi:multidrug efflux pump subunit AcrA (membrane-fusion protein)